MQKTVVCRITAAVMQTTVERVAGALGRALPSGSDYLMSFQNAALRRQATTVNAARNSITQTPIRTRLF